MPNARYFSLNDDIGLDHEGNPQPLVELGLTYTVPTMTEDGEVIDSVSTITLTAIPGTRIVKVDDALVANVVADHPLYHEVDAPSKKQLDAARKDTVAARETPPPADDTPDAGQEG